MVHFDTGNFKPLSLYVRISESFSVIEMDSFYNPTITSPVAYTVIDRFR